MRIDVIPISELSEDLKRIWMRIQATNPSLMNPFFHPELFISAGKNSPDVYVAILYKDNDLAGFLPFQKDHKLKIAQSFSICNFEGIISSPNQNWDMNLILKTLGLKAWNLKALVDFKNIKPKRGAYQVNHSFRIDLTEGLEKYWAFIQTKKLRLKDLNDKRRKLGIIKGSLRFVPDCKDIKVFHQLSQWKVNRHNPDLQKWKEVSDTMEHILNLKDPLFQGVMPSLYAGDELVAVDFHLRFNGHLGGIHRAFNPNFEKFSVGVLLLHDVINEHKTLGYNVLDLGPEVFQYKVEYSNTTLPTLKGDFKLDSIKETIKSVNWIYECLLPMARLKGKIVTKLSKSG